ncbi:MAG: flagellar biosynthesis protein FliQ [Firmicutes bacterium]|nr:flagellar biosynthesis protein FliQ [Bacillota bacterium]
MSQSETITIIQQALYTILIVSAPMLGVALLIGLVVSVFQAATQINEQTLAFVPKIIGVFAALIIFGPWMLNKLMDFSVRLFDYMNLVAR